MPRRTEAGFKCLSLSSVLHDGLWERRVVEGVVQEIYLYLIVYFSRLVHENSPRGGAMGAITAMVLVLCARIYMTIAFYFENP